MAKYIPNIRLENTRIVRKNFSGEKFSDKKRTFGVIIPDELVDRLIADGWNIKFFPPAPDDPEQHATAFLMVKLHYGKYPPSVVLVTSKGRVALNENTVGQLDRTRIKAAKVVIRANPYPAIMGRPEGVSAYCNALTVEMDESPVRYEDPFAEEYADVPFADSYEALMSEFREGR